MTNDFDDIFERLTWEMIKLSDGNPYLWQDLVAQRDAFRESQLDKTEILKEQRKTEELRTI